MTATNPLASLDPSTIVRERLPNGLTLIIRRDPSAPVAAVVTYVKAGYFDESDDVVGIAHVLEHMFFKGTEKRAVGEIAKETKASGGYLNAHTIYDHTSYYAVLPIDGFARGLEIQADAYANSVIAAPELAKELEVIIQEAKRKLDNPGAVATETLYEMLHDRHRIRRWRIGREEGLRQLSRDDLVRFYRNFYRPSNTVLVIVGDVDVEETRRTVERLYGALPDAPIERSKGASEIEAPGFRYREWTGDIAQTQLVMGWRTPAMLDADTPLLDLAAAVLATGRGSRLYRAVRERQLAASVGAYDYTPTELGVFVVHAETQPDTVADAARAIWAQLHDLRENGVTAEELERAQRILEARWIRRMETMDGQANHLAEWEAAGDFHLGDAYLEQLLSATPEQVTEAVRRHLLPEQAAVAIYRPATSELVAADAAAMRVLLSGEEVDALPNVPVTTAVAPAVASPVSFEREEHGVRVYRTTGGVPLLVRRKPGAPIVNLGFYTVGGASQDSPDQAGLSLLMAQTAVKGTERRTAAQIAVDAELLGGSVGASAGSESIGWSISVPAQHVAAAAELLADVVQRPIFPEGAFENERAVALADVAQLRDDMYRYPMRLATGAAFAGHPYGQPVMGSEPTLRTLTVDAARARHRDGVRAGASVIAVVGEGDPDELAAIVAREFDRVTMREAPSIVVPAWPGMATLSIESREKRQTALAMTFPGPRRGEQSRFAARLLVGIASGLGGRFFDELRDRQSLAYTVQAFTSERRAAGMIAAYIATGPHQEEQARRGLLAEFAKLREAPVTDAELERAKTYSIGTHAIASQSGASLLGDMVDAWLFGGLHELSEHDTMVRAVTPQDILAVANESFDAERRVEGVIRGIGGTA
jgi:zinc protease